MQKPEAPLPTAAGVLGIARTIRARPSAACSKAASFTPAAIEMTKAGAFDTATKCPSAAQASCGLVQSKTTSQAAKAEISSATCAPVAAAN